ncbi:hypothetical protein LX36DRAFT_383254 [Colletotrichum falcatum]|nr:hypothetical protein LX36DRAFT_383254 [Colletotrichum falcatum]
MHRDPYRRTASALVATHTLAYVVDSSEGKTSQQAKIFYPRRGVGSLCPACLPCRKGCGFEADRDAFRTSQQRQVCVRWRRGRRRGDRRCYYSHVWLTSPARLSALGSKPQCRHANPSLQVRPMRTSAPPKATAGHSCATPTDTSLP